MAITKTITWNDTSSATIPELVIGQVSRSLIGSPRGVQAGVAGREGSYFFPERRGRRKVTADCFIEVDDMADRRDAVTAVADWFDVETQAKLYISDEPGVYYEAVIASAPDVDEWREVGKFTLEWEVNPFAFDENTSVETWTSDADDTHVWNPGLSTILYPVIEITPTNGTIVGFTLTTNGDALNYTATIADDATVTINSIATIVLAGINTDLELTGAYDPDDALMAGVSGVFPTLIPGSNSIRFQRLAGTATAITVTVTYRPRYRK